MTKKSFVILVLVLVTGGIVGYSLSKNTAKNASGSGDATGTATEESKPVAQVETAAIEHKSISQTLAAYGGVPPQVFYSCNRQKAPTKKRTRSSNKRRDVLT